MLVWSKLTLLDLSIIDTLEEKPGVFRLSYKSAENAYYVFYVGKADTSIRAELRKIKTATDNPCIKTHLDNLECYFVYAYLPKGTNTRDVERTLYEKYKPRCNLSTPEGKVIEVNFN